MLLDTKPQITVQPQATDASYRCFRMEYFKVQYEIFNYNRLSSVSSVKSSEISETAHDHTTHGRNNPHTIRPSVWLLFMTVLSQEMIVIQGSGSKEQLGVIEMLFSSKEMKGLFPNKDIAYVQKTDV